MAKKLQIAVNILYIYTNRCQKIMKQVRKIRPNYRSVTGRLPYKNTSLPYESTLERDFLIYHTFREDVIEIIPQPLQIPFIKNGRTYSYTPDFFVRFSDESHLKPMIVEVKPYEQWRTNWRDWSDKWKAMQRHCSDNGYIFRIYDENRIRHQALENINFLNRFKNLNCSQSEKNIILNQVEAMGNTTIDYLLARFYLGSMQRQHGLRMIYSLLANQRLRCNIFAPLNDFMEVWVGEE